MIPELIPPCPLLLEREGGVELDLNSHFTISPKKLPLSFQERGPGGEFCLKATPALLQTIIFMIKNGKPYASKKGLILLRGWQEGLGFYANRW
jgi:hypothetical protein